MYQWDEVERITSLANHGVDFASMEAFVWENAIQRLDDRHSEPRFVVVGISVTASTSSCTSNMAIAFVS